MFIRRAVNALMTALSNVMNKAAELVMRGNEKRVALCCGDGSDCGLSYGRLHSHVRGNI